MSKANSKQVENKPVEATTTEVSVEEKARQGKGADNPKPKRNSKGKSGKPGRGKGQAKTPRSPKEDRDDKDNPRPRNINDVRWYVKYPSLVAGASSHIFNARLGHKYVPFSLSDTSGAGQRYIGYGEAIPGVVSLVWTPWFSLTGDEADAVNVASKNLYTYIRHANSGSVNYESSDLMQYVLACIELFAYAEQCKRDLKLIFTFNTRNIYLYKRVLNASGYLDADINDMINFYALYQNRLNIVIAKLNTFKIPAEMSVLDRHVWLASHVWKDDDLEKSTSYIYNMQGFYHYDWVNGELQFNPIFPQIGQNISFANRLSALETEIDNLLAYEDIGIMLGDILKAYGNDKCYFAKPLMPGEIYEAEYSSEVTHQIRNAIVTGGSYTQRIKQMPSNSQLLYETQADNAPTVIPCGSNSGTPVTLTMNNGTFYFPTQITGGAAPSFGGVNRWWSYKPFLVIDSNNPTNEEITLNTRLMSVISSTGYQTDGPDNKVVAQLGETGTEVIVSSAIVTYETTMRASNPKQFTEVLNSGPLTTIQASNGVNPAALHILSQQYKVDSIPQRVVITYDGGGGSYNYYLSQFYYGKNVISVEEEWLKLLHQGCKLSEFTIPMFKLLESSK